MPSYAFSNSWFQQSARGAWERLLPALRPRKILEIGSFEGQSACFLIDALGADAPLELHCIDTFAGGVEHRPAARRGLVKLLLIDPNGTPNTGDNATATHAVEL